MRLYLSILIGLLFLVFDSKGQGLPGSLGARSLAPLVCPNVYSIASGTLTGSIGTTVRQLNITDGTSGPVLGTLPTGVVSYAAGIDPISGNLAFLSISTSPSDIYTFDGTTMTKVGTLATSGIFYRAGFFRGTHKMCVMSGNGGELRIIDFGTSPITISSNISITTSPASAPSFSTKTGGDLLFDYDGNGYIVVNGGEFYRLTINTTTNTANATYLGVLSLQGAPSALLLTALAFDINGNLLVGGTSAPYVGVINLQTLNVVQISPSSGTDVYYTVDFASCNFPVIRPNLSASKTYQKVSGSAGAAIITNDIIEYTITVKNTGNISAGNVTLSDIVPAGTTYVANSTTMNGVAVADVAGAMPFAVSKNINSSTDAVGVVVPVSTGRSAAIKFRAKITATSGMVTNNCSVAIDQVPVSNATVSFVVNCLSAKAVLDY